MSDVRFTHVDGVRVAYLEKGPEQLTASLIFGTGAFDETLFSSGITHLLEHAALHGSHRLDAAVNGSVSGLLTTFDIRGTPAEVVEFLSIVCSRIHAFAPDDIDHERGVLHAEDSSKDTALTAHVLSVRYGPQGPGASAWPDFGVAEARAEDLQRLAAARFTADNAALALDGPLPPGLRLPLPRGVVAARQDPVPLPWPIPMGDHVGRSVVVVTGLIPRSPALPLGMEIWLRRARRRLEGVVSPKASVRGLSEFVGRSVMAGLAVDAGPTQAARVLELVRAELVQLIAEGPTATELADEVAYLQLLNAHPDFHEGEPVRVGREAMAGFTPRTDAQRLAEAEQVSPADVQAMLAQVAATEQIMVPRGTDTSGAPDVHWDPVSSRPAEPRGRTIRLAGVRGLLDRNAPTLRLGQHTLSYTNSDGTTTTLALGEVAAAVVYGDRRVFLLDRDGTSLTVEEPIWRSRHLVPTVLAKVPPDRIIRRPVDANKPPAKPETVGEYYTRAVLRFTRRKR